MQQTTSDLARERTGLSQAPFAMTEPTRCCSPLTTALHKVGGKEDPLV